MTLSLNFLFNVDRAWRALHLTKRPKSFTQELPRFATTIIDRFIIET
ncbi:hypothetical protein CTAM01_16515 [Colletotrichum tamarilloi]|uniref:Uncharacterized protein n=1 Tax=Colletotrichum tamarilloi TaxID=1209934 RepID=A0ABQ9QI91_9PEZI|nr:uncharacterized protein CTAM01_16515 [Colletotrichum tamarilloi]KAK1471415.1 hypothetical protein CTAM01_16515 [Colletotrichum tamarilloi]